MRNSRAGKPSNAKQSLFQLIARREELNPQINKERVLIINNYMESVQFLSEQFEEKDVIIYKS